MTSRRREKVKVRIQGAGESSPSSALLPFAERLASQLTLEPGTSTKAVSGVPKEPTRTNWFWA